MNLSIDPNNIEHSFDEIALKLLREKALLVNNTEFRFTEIEFYYFHQGIHEDNYTHEHRRDAGEWRFHNQGLDITFQSNKDSDGGILIRGIWDGKNYTNGPRLVVGKIFEAMGKVTHSNTLKIEDASHRQTSIWKTFRHLPNKVQYPEYHNRAYRYLTDLGMLKITTSNKQRIKENSRNL